jgi:small GTP-binding protein
MVGLPLFKVVVVGDGAVGKTTLIRRYCEGKFHASRVATIGVDFYTQRVQLPGGMIKLSIWDMAGQERFQVVRTGFYRGSRATAMVYDVTKSISLINLRQWRAEVLSAVSGQKLLVVGNKVDLERSVHTPVGQAFAAYIGVPYLETSALSGGGVSLLFETLARLATRV